MYDLPYRNYDAALGRFFQVDPLSHASHNLTPYHYAGNNPSTTNDPSGLILPSPDYQTENREKWSNSAWTESANWSEDVEKRYLEIMESNRGGDSSNGDLETVDALIFKNGVWTPEFGYTRFKDVARMLKNYGFGVAIASRMSPDPSLHEMGASLDDGWKLTQGEASIGDLFFSQIQALSTMISLSGADCPNCIVADYLRNIPMLSPMQPNPFYGAEAIFADKGYTITGFEKDEGAFFMLVGPEIGQFVSYSEEAWGSPFEANYGVELGRIDVGEANPNDVTSDYLFGYRQKFWASYGSPTLIGPSIGIGVAWGSYQKFSVLGVSLQLSYGAGFNVDGWGVGYNKGVISR